MVRERLIYGGLVALGFFVAAGYWEGWIDPATMPRWIVLAILPWFLRGNIMTSAHWIGLAFIGWAAISLLWTPVFFWGVGGLFWLAFIAVFFMFGNAREDLRPLYIGCAWGMGVSSLLAIVQLSGYQPLEHKEPISGLFVNGNDMAGAAALILVALVAEKLYWYVPLVLPAFILPAGRGAFLAACVALAFHFRAHWRVVVPIAIAACFVMLVYSFSKGSSFIDSETERVTLWYSTWNGLIWTGHGIGSFWPAFLPYDLRVDPTSRPETAHNELLTIAFELGAFGVLLTIAFCLALVRLAPAACSLVLIALLVESAIDFPLHLPVTAFLGLVCAGHAVRSTSLLRRDFLHRAGLRRAWQEFFATGGRSQLSNAGKRRYALRSQVL
jgi:hypothetical protein